MPPFSWMTGEHWTQSFETLLYTFCHLWKEFKIIDPVQSEWVLILLRSRNQWLWSFHRQNKKEWKAALAQRNKAAVWSLWEQWYKGVIAADFPRCSLRRVYRANKCLFVWSVSFPTAISATRRSVEWKILLDFCSLRFQALEWFRDEHFNGNDRPNFCQNDVIGMSLCKWSEILMFCC